MIYVICSYPVTFFGANSEIFVISQIGEVVEAPEWIQDTILFDYLVRSELLQVVEKPEEPPKKETRKKK